jgi:hypothetical protein
MKYDSKQKIAVVFLLILFFCVVGAGLSYRNSQKEKYQPIDRSESRKSFKPTTEEEPSESYILVSKVVFAYPNRITTRIYDNGDIEKSTVIDELLANGTAPQDTFIKEKKLTKEQITQIEKAIETLQATPKTETATETYGLSISIDKDLVDIRNYNQEAIDNFNTLIESLIN